MSVITALAWAQRRKCNKFTDILWPSWIINKERCSRDVFLFIIRAKSLSLFVDKQITDHSPCICILLISFAQNVLDRNPSASTDKRHCLTWSVSTNLDHCWTKVVTIDNSSPLFATVRDCSPLFVAIRDYSGFIDTQASAVYQASFVKPDYVSEAQQKGTGMITKVFTLPKFGLGPFQVSNLKSAGEMASDWLIKSQISYGNLEK